MAAAHLETTRHPVSALVLRVRLKLNRVVVRAARGGHRVGSLPGPQQLNHHPAAPAVGPGAAHGKVSADVSLQQTRLVKDSLSNGFSFCRYIQCIHQKLYHLTVADYEEFSSTILSARNAFQITPEGSAQFKDWLQSIKRSKSCKKELWTQINAALNSK